MKSPSFPGQQLRESYHSKSRSEGEWVHQGIYADFVDEVDTEPQIGNALALRAFESQLQKVQIMWI
jgi:hypothetical protein